MTQSKAQHLFLIAVFILTLIPAPAARGQMTVDQMPGDESPYTAIQSVTLAIIDSLAVVSDAPVPEEAWLPRIFSKPGGELNDGLIAHDRDAIAAVFHEHGYWRAIVEVTADSSSAAGTILTFTVYAGPPAILGTISIDGPLTVSGWTATLPAESGSIFASDILKPYVEVITTHLTHDGYPDTQVIPVLKARGDTVDVVLSVIPGMQAVIDSLAVTGLTRTRDNVVLRELSSLRGLPATTDAVATARTLIGSLDIVTLTDDPVILYPNTGSATLALRLVEGPQGSFDGVLGYQPAAGSSEGELIGKIDLAFPNLAGTGRTAAFRWENLGADTEDLAISYREPWVLGLPYSFSGSFMQEQRDRLGYTRTIMQWSFTRSFGHLDAEAGYRYEKISADSLTSSSGHGIDLSARWTALDNRLNPRSGIRYGVVWSRLAKSYRFGALADHILERTEFDLDHYIPSITGQAVALMVRYRSVNTPGGDITLADRYWLGGSNSIRGYREQSFPAVEAIWANVEYRFIQSGRSRVFVFFDHGYLTNEESQADGSSKKKIRSVSGYGFGLRIGSRAGTLGFDYGLGEGDSPGEGKLHVSLSNYF